jgi:hypothetical protein
MSKADEKRQVAQPQVEDEELPWLARVVQHILTPGSSHTSGMWLLMNVLIFCLFLVWIIFLFNFPLNIHVWVFGTLLLGLAVTTNIFMKEVFAAKLDFDSRQKAEGAEQATELPAANEPAPKTVAEGKKKASSSPLSKGKGSKKSD